MSETSLAQKRRRLLAARGYRATVTQDELRQAQAKLRSFRARGMPLAKMSEVTGIISSSLYSFQHNSGMLMSNWLKIARMPFVPPTGSTLIDSTGTRRRLGGLWRDGFPLPFLAERIGDVDRLYLQRMIRGRAGTAPLNRVTADRAARVQELYGKLELQKPAELGIDPGQSKRASAYATKRGCPPSHCWDPDTIDDPDAIAEWTGACGTANGLRIHQREGIPACPPCLAVNLGPAAGAIAISPAKVRAAREVRGLSRQEVADALGVHRSTLEYWESGRSAPRDRNLTDRYLAVLDLNPEEAT